MQERMPRILSKTILLCLIITLFPISSTLTAKNVEEGYINPKEECDKYRKEISSVDSASVQSYIARVNKERAANLVAQQTLRNNRQRNMLITYIVMGGMLVIGLLVAGLIMLRKYKRRLMESKEKLNHARQIVEN